MNFVGKEIAGLGFLKEIAQGARSRIFLVSHEGELRAAKFFLPEYHHFAQQEYLFGSRLEHPNLNKVESLVEAEELRGVLMPFVKGENLSVYFANLDLFLVYFEQLLAGIGYLHEQGIIHRDIKPENIIVDAGVPKLLDFDLAVRADGPYKKRSLAGTIAYFSPEELQGASASVQSDLYAAGIILYRALTGELPFTGSIEEVVDAHKYETAKLPSEFDLLLKPFDAVLNRALAKDPAERFESAKALSLAIQAVVGLPSVAV